MNVGERTSRLRVLTTTNPAPGRQIARVARAPSVAIAGPSSSRPPTERPSSDACVPGPPKHPSGAERTTKCPPPWMTTTRMPGRELSAVACQASAVPGHSGLLTSDQGIVRIDLDPNVSSR